MAESSNFLEVDSKILENKFLLNVRKTSEVFQIIL